jgi:hypothetical protein
MNETDPIGELENCGKINTPRSQLSPMNLSFTPTE